MEVADKIRCELEVARQRVRVLEAKMCVQGKNPWGSVTMEFDYKTTIGKQEITIPLEVEPSVRVVCDKCGRSLDWCYSYDKESEALSIEVLETCGCGGGDE